jgi:hypothetical protein
MKTANFFLILHFCKLRLKPAHFFILPSSLFPDSGNEWLLKDGESEHVLRLPGRQWCGLLSINVSKGLHRRQAMPSGSQNDGINFIINRSLQKANVARFPNPHKRVGYGADCGTDIGYHLNSLDQHRFTFWKHHHRLIRQCFSQRDFRNT